MCAHKRAHIPYENDKCINLWIKYITVNSSDSLNSSDKRSQLKKTRDPLE